MEGELRDDQWALIAPLLPRPKVRGRPRADDRRTINGILWACAPAPGGGTSPRGMAAPQPATAASKSGKTRESESRFG